jgi:hypothetical protein
MDLKPVRDVVVQVSLGPMTETCLIYYGFKGVRVER